MRIKEGMEKEYRDLVEVNNHNGYSADVISYLERWADKMEEVIADGVTVQAAAKATRFQADTEGITRYMYGCAVNILSRFWAHGEELKMWHNHQYGYEGDGTVNPAILSIESEGSAEEPEQSDELGSVMVLGQ